MRFAFLLMLSISAASYAEDPFSCVDPDVSDVFLGNMYRDRGVYSISIPDGFPSLNVPVDLLLVGSKVVDTGSTIVYKTNMGSEPAFKLAIKDIGESGWTEILERYRSGSRGFQSRSKPMSAILCNDDESGSMSVVSYNKSGQTFVTYVHHATSQPCDGPPSFPPGHDTSEIMGLVPTLMLPEGVKSSNSGFEGRGDDVISRVDISGATGRSELLNYLEGQVQQQGWEFQTSWSSQHSSGSIWALNTDEDGILIGTLHVFDSGVDPIRVRFNVNATDPIKRTINGS